jgi:hypothetical protein
MNSNRFPYFSSESIDFMDCFTKNEESLCKAETVFADIHDFYCNQRKPWDALRDALARFEMNRFDLEKNEESERALARMREIIDAPAPYTIIKESSALIQKVETVNTQLIEWAQKETLEIFNDFNNKLVKVAEEFKVPKKELELSLAYFKEIEFRLNTEKSVANLIRYRTQASEVFNREFNRLQATVQDQTRNQPLQEVQTFLVRNEVRQPYLQTDQDVDEFVNALSMKLKQMIKAGKRVRLE